MTASICKIDVDTFKQLCTLLPDLIRSEHPAVSAIYGVPRGGIPVAQEISHRIGVPLISNLEDSDGDVVIVDDIVDSGETRLRYSGYPFYALVGKDRTMSFPMGVDFPRVAMTVSPDVWVEFWWEAGEAPAEDAVCRILEVIGDDPNREGLKETPHRVLKSFKELYSGYAFKEADIKATLKTFTEGACDEMVLVKDIELYSTCEHHMLPFIGKCHIGYIPNGKVVGVSKLVRLMEIFSRRLQIQERIGDQVTEALMTHLGAKGAACVIEAQHLCMRMRGVEKQNSVMVTSSMKGAFRDKPETRAEFMALIK